MTVFKYPFNGTAMQSQPTKYTYTFDQSWCRVHDNSYSSLKKVEEFIDEKLQSVGLVLDEDYYIDRPACTNEYFQIGFNNDDAVVAAKMVLV